VAVAWGSILAGAGREQHPDPLLGGPPDAAFTGGALVAAAAGLAAGLLARGPVGWLAAASGLVVGLALVALLGDAPRLLHLETILLGLAPLTLGYVAGQALPGARRREHLLLLAAIGLWLPVAALAVLGLLAAVSSPGLGEDDWPTVAAALLVSIVVPVGLVGLRRPSTRAAGLLLLAVVGLSAALWALLDGGYGRPLWEAAVSPPLVGVMLTLACLGTFMGAVAILLLVAPAAPVGADPSRTA
jgi:hypothetical protein